MAQAILLIGQVRRRRWSADDRLEILEVAFAPGANVSEVARRFDASTRLIYTWRRQELAVAVKDGPTFVPAMVFHPQQFIIAQQHNQAMGESSTRSASECQTKVMDDRLER